MSLTVYRNARIEVNGVDLSDHCRSLTVNFSSAMLDATAMGADTKINKGGLFAWTIDADFNQDEAAANVDATLFPLVGVTSCIEVRPFNTCSTVINPRLFGIGILASYPPMGGAVGSLLVTKAQFQAAGSLGRSTTAT